MSGQHHKYSPSSLEILERCCHYEKSEMDSDAAQRGTQLHAACETGHYESIVDEDDRTIVMKVLYTMQLLKDQYPDYIECKEIELDGIINHGTGDHFLLSPDHTHAVITDYKFGVVEVAPIEDNIQLGNYALNAFDMFGSLQRVTVGILQPEHSDEIQMYTYDKSEMGRVIRRIESIVERREHRELFPPTPDTKACLHCAAKARCPAMNAIVLDSARSAYGLALPTNWMLGTEKTPEQRAALQSIKPIMTDWLELMGKENAEYVRGGGTIDGFKLVSRAGNWTVTDQKKAHDWLIENGMSEEDLWQFVKINGKKAVEFLAGSNSMLDASSLITQIATQGDPIQYLKADHKKKKVKELK